MGMGNMQQIMQQAKKMQEDMARKQAELENSTFEGSSGGGAVKVEVRGNLEITGIKINDEVVSLEDKEMLEDLILAAVNDGLKKAQSTSEAEMGKITGGIKIPGL